MISVVCGVRLAEQEFDDAPRVSDVTFKLGVGYLGHVCSAVMRVSCVENDGNAGFGAWCNVAFTRLIS